MTECNDNKKYDDIIFNLTMALFDALDFKHVDDPEFINCVCNVAEITQEEYKTIVNNPHLRA